MRPQATRVKLCARVCMQQINGWYARASHREREYKAFGCEDEDGGRDKPGECGKHGG